MPRIFKSIFSRTIGTFLVGLLRGS
ncbi:hypothetical protein ES724_04785 [Gillisia hiemivivida]|uniref:Uncharacterized protein n=1 Tax=Gillisia hiemivivida TaxID=291190 RepID=A0A5C6ZXA9_9FLAO|nr:hypothetical protein ES724_04785 [Gillisia hiemivivida]